MKIEELDICSLFCLHSLMSAQIDKPNNYIFLTNSTLCMYLPNSIIKICIAVLIIRKYRAILIWLIISE